MYRPIGLLVLAAGLVFLPTAQATVVVQTSLSLDSLLITSSDPTGVVELIPPFSASVALSGEDSLSGFGTCPQSSQVNDASTGLISCASALQSANGSASSLGDLTSALAATAANAINIPEITASASNSSESGLGVDQGGTGLFEIYDALNSTPTNVDVTFTATLSGGQTLITDMYGVSATSEIIFTLQVPGTSAALFYYNLISIGPSTSVNTPLGPPNTIQTNTATLQTNTQYTLFAEADAESSGNNVLPEPSSFFLTALGVFTALYAGWRIKRGSRNTA